MMAIRKEDEHFYGIPRLNSDNYHIWAIRARGYLEQKKLWAAIEPGFGDEMTQAEAEANSSAKNFIIQVIDDNLIDDVYSSERAREAWLTLKEMNSSLGLLYTLQLLRELINVEKKSDESMQEYLSRVQHLHNRLATCGEGLDDRKLGLVMLLGLPKSYEQLILSLEQDEIKISSKTVKIRLLVEEKQQNGRNGSHALQAELEDPKALRVQKKQPYRNLHKRDDDRDKRKVRCFCCGKMGHIARNCLTKDDAEKSSHARFYADVKALSATEKKAARRYTWTLDSGATRHMTPYRDKLSNIRQTNSYVTMANAKRIQATAVGDAYMHISEKHGGRHIVLKDVLLVPALGENLMSARQMEKKGMQIILEAGEAKIKECSTGELILRAISKDEEYQVEEEDASRAYAVKEKDDDLQLWHRRLGHLHITAVKQVAKATSIEMSRNEVTACETCIQGKAKKLPFPTSTSKPAKWPLERVHSDLMGPFEPASKGGTKYVMTFVDEATNHVTVYFLKTKDEAINKFKQYVNEAENQLNRKVKILRTDNGREYINTKFEEFINEKGILHEKTIPYNPQQNGKAERENQTLMNMTRCLLIDSGLPKLMWAEALNTAAYIRNRCPSTAIDNDIPIERWTGKKLDVSNLKVFGCKAFMNIPKEQQHSKLNPRARACVFVGYPPHVKGYKLWCPDNDKFYYSRDVVFLENKFPFMEGREKTDIDAKWPNIPNNPLPRPEIDIPVSEGLDEMTTVQDANTIDVKEAMDSNGIDEREGALDDVIQPTVFPVSMEQTSSQPQTQDGPRRSARIAEKYKQTTVDTARQAVSDEIEPKTVAEALRGRSAERWREAMREEIQNHHSNHTFEIVSRPTDQRVIRSKWVFKLKKDEDGKIIRYKSRLCAVGCSQQYGVDFLDSFSPVIRLRTVRLLVAMGIELGWIMYQVDVVAAYLNEPVKETIYMEQPEGFEEGDPEKFVCHVKKSIYGLKQAGRNWNECLNRFLIDCGLTRSQAEPCVYFSERDGIIVGDYVDDLVIIARCEEVANHYLTKIKSRFEVKSAGRLTFFLSIRFQWFEDGSVTLDQKAYAESILHEHGMDWCNPVAVPIDPSWRHLDTDDCKNTTDVSDEYRQILGKLLFLANTTRPDLSFTAAYLSQFNSCADMQYLRMVKHALKYLKGTTDTRLTYRPTGQFIQLYADADWASNPCDRKSFTGYVGMLAGGAFTWRSQKQRSVALSSTEAELIALCQTAKEAVWISEFLCEIRQRRFADDAVRIRADNQGAICMATNQTVSDRGKHIELKHFFIRDLVADEKIAITYITSENNLADGLTKRLPRVKMERFVNSIGLTRLTREASRREGVLARAVSGSAGS